MPIEELEDAQTQDALRSELLVVDVRAYAGDDFFGLRRCFVLKRLENSQTQGPAFKTIHPVDCRHYVLRVKVEQQVADAIG